MKVNRNILWTETFVEELVNAGVEHACISPGSRSTPLTYAFITNKRIKSFSIIDERSSGFFALGLAKSTGKPVILVCTSGTAAAEFYPAIIEAYQSKVPLIVCTADRPPELQNVGANQTINQNDIYKNHICWFSYAGLPQANRKRLNDIKNIAKQALIECSIKNVGPVHINFPFKKPFEPNAFTDEIDQKELQSVRKAAKFSLNFQPKKSSFDEKKNKLISSKISSCTKGIIIVGLDNYSKGFFSACHQLSIKTGYPIFADASSNMRFMASQNQNILVSYESYLRSKKFIAEHEPDFIIQFGRNFSSKALSNFISGSSCEKLLVNQFGDWKNPTDKSTSVLDCDPEIFCRKICTSSGVKPKNNKKHDWLNEFLTLDKSASRIKQKLIDNAVFPSESRILSELLAKIPKNSNLMISNSLPIRDFDLSAPLMQEKIKVFHNRGASGIDGIISTALGIAKSSKNKTFLLTGDLAFFYDMNSLQIAKKYSIRLKIILINNNGGRIFEVLPISSYKKIFEEYFATPHNLDFKKFIWAYQGNYNLAKSWNDFGKWLRQDSSAKTFSVLEIKTNPKKSLALRRKYFEKVISQYESELRD